MKQQTTEVNGLATRWIERDGGGPPVVLVHGIPTSPRLWRRVMPLVDDARLLAWEMIGYGDGIPDGEGRDLSVSRQADYLLEWLDVLGIDRAVLVGHDLGGGVVQIASVRRPSLCAGLVLTNSICYDSWPIPSVKALRAAGPLVSRLRGWSLGMAMVPLFARGHDDGVIAGDSLKLHLAPYHAAGGGRALVRQMKALSPRDTLAIQDELPALRDRPVRIVWGAADPFQKLKYGERLARDLGGVLVTIRDGRHFVPEDHPDAIAAAIQSALDDARFPRTQRAAHPGA